MRPREPAWRSRTREGVWEVFGGAHRPASPICAPSHCDRVGPRSHTFASCGVLIVPSANQPLADSQADVDAAKKEFDAARGEAAAKRAAMGKGKGGPGEGGQFTPMDLDAMPGAKASVVGTFNAAAVSGLGLGGGVFEEMKHQLNRIGDNGEKLLDEVQMGGRWD